jgi:hypothetical protein
MVDDGARMFSAVNSLGCESNVWNPWVLLDGCWVGGERRKWAPVLFRLDPLFSLFLARLQADGRPAEGVVFADSAE